MISGLTRQLFITILFHFEIDTILWHLVVCCSGTFLLKSLSDFITINTWNVKIYASNHFISSKVESCIKLIVLILPSLNSYILLIIRGYDWPSQELAGLDRSRVLSSNEKSEASLKYEYILFHKNTLGDNNAKVLNIFWTLTDNKKRSLNYARVILKNVWNI